MKTFETEKHNIPEGATHYRDECSEWHFLWLKYDDKKGWHKCTSAGHHRASWVEGDMVSKIKEIPEDKPLDAIEQPECNGEGLPPVGVECEMIFRGKSKLITPLYFTDFVDGMVLFYHSSNSMPHCDDTYDWCLVENCIFRKPETEEQRKEREELEAAYDLYCEFRSKNNLTVCSIDNLDREPGFEFVMFLVRKTGYRKRE